MQLTRPDSLTPNNPTIILKKAKEYKVKNSKLQYKRIPIETKYPDGKKGAIVIETPFLFSFGVNEKKSQETDKLVGYSIPVCLWERDRVPSEAEREFYEFIRKFVVVCKQQLEEEYGADMATSMTDPFITKRLNMLTRKGKRKLRQISRPRQYFMQNLFTLTKQKKFFLCLEQREKKVLILLIILISIAM